jgi:hypothetical protein
LIRTMKEQRQGHQMAFEPGQSGNPAGRPVGVKDRRTELRDLLQPHAAALIKKAVDLALKGDTTALRLCLDRLCPPLKPQAEAVVIDISGTPSEQAGQVVASAASGDITPDAAAAIMELLTAQVRIEDMTAVKADIEEIKALLKANKLNEENDRWRQSQLQQFKSSKTNRR